MAGRRCRAGSPQAGSPHPGQPYPGQPYPGQPYPGQPYPGQPYPGQPYPGQPYGGQPSPGQPNPGDASAGPVPMGPVTTQFARLNPGPSQTFGWLSLLVTAVGAAMVVVAFTAVDWGQRSDSFRQLNSYLRAIDSLHNGVMTEPVARAYFSWLGWALLVVCAVCAALAAVPVIGVAFRFLGPLLAAAAVVLTFLAIKLIANSDRLGITEGYRYYLRHARVGFWLTLAGFVIIGVGSALGPGHEPD